MSKKYDQYFDIDTRYFPVVNADAMKADPDLWKKFFPHDSFIKLLKSSLKMIAREGGKPRGIWVHGSYGTGKSHAVLTLKKLWEATPEDTESYFNEYRDLLDRDLLKQFLQVKNSGRILTVHKYASSGIRSDMELVNMIQQSISEALQEAGLADTGTGSMKDAILEWLKDGPNKNYFDALIKDRYFSKFGGASADDVIKKLNDLTGDELWTLINRIMDVGKQENIGVFKLDVEKLKVWIEDIINQHHLKGILLIWDEFSEYLNNNKNDLTGFQTIVEWSQKMPFYMLVVAHRGNNIFEETDHRRKIFDRFDKPTLEIALPESMAFKLMNRAMRRTKDTKLANEWKHLACDLYRNTTNSRDKVIKKCPGVEKETLENIMPIQPFTAIFLKNLATSFESNQRSMFDFIKNTDNMDYHGFQWFIHEYGPFDDEPLFMLDMMWDYFYEKNKTNLSEKVRTVLGYYDRVILDHDLSEKEQRVLKTILLLQGVSEQAETDFFEPTPENIELAFEGSDTFKNGVAKQIAISLKDKKIIYERQTKKSTSYNAMVHVVSDSALEALIEKMKQKSTLEMVTETPEDILGLQGNFKLRCRFHKLTDQNFYDVMKRLRMPCASLDTHMDVAMTFAKTEEEADLLRQKLKDNFKESDSCIIIDSSGSQLGKDKFEQYAENLANCDYHKNKNQKLAAEYEKYAHEIRSDWFNRIKTGEFTFYSKHQTKGVRVTNVDQIRQEILRVLRSDYRLALDVNFRASDTQWSQSNYTKGCISGMNRKLESMFKSSTAAMSLEKQLGKVWKQEDYWKGDAVLDKPAGKAMAEIKNIVENCIQNAFKTNGRVSIEEIYGELEKPPVALLPCGVTAFMLGFVLSEYASPDYTWTNELNSDTMSPEKLVEIVDGICKLKTGAPGAGKQKTYYIVKDKEEIRQFNRHSGQIFSLSEGACDSVQHVRDAIREKMRTMYFPMRCLKSNLSAQNLSSSAADVSALIDSYMKFVNNTDNDKSENDIAIEIGKSLMEDSYRAVDLQKLVKSKEALKKGMDAYLGSYKDGILKKLAKDIDDKNAEYLNRLKTKLDAKEANWVWQQEMIDEKIDEVICEYEIMVNSRFYVSVNAKFKDLLEEWRRKCQDLKHACDAVKPHLSPEMAQFADVLKAIYAGGSLTREDCTIMRDVLDSHRSEVTRFFDIHEQYKLFKLIFANELADLDDDEKQKIYDEQCDSHVWNHDLSSFMENTRRKIAQYINESARGRLLDLWKAKTGSDNPKKWSERYMMPILCMFEGPEQREAEEMFEIINCGTTDNEKVHMAMRYLEDTDFYTRLADQNARDEAFKRVIIGEFDALCDDMDDVRDRLESTAESPYSWYNSPRVRNEMKSFAQEKYVSSGCDIAIEKIENMDPEEAKQYLKTLIRDNMNVGMEIIRKHKG